MSPPIPARKPHDVSLHGVTRIDDWYWLRERDDPEVIAHLHAENAHTLAWFAPLEGREAAPLRRDAGPHPGGRRRGALAQERLVALEPHGERPPVRDLAAPARRARRPRAGDARPQRLAEGKPFLQLGAFDVSPDTTLLAYSLDETGALDYTLRVRGLASGEDLPLAIEKTEGAARGNDSRTLYYLKTPPSLTAPWQPPAYNQSHQSNLNRRKPMETQTYQTDRRYRLAFGATFFTGMAVCTFGIANTTKFGWLHPSSLSGIALGLTAVVLGGGVLMGRKIGPVASDKSALTTLLGIIIIKFILAALYPIFR